MLTQLLLSGSATQVREAGLHICSSVISSGFSSVEYRPLKLESCFLTFHNFLSVAFTAEKITKEWKGHRFPHLKISFSGDGSL